MKKEKIYLLNKGIDITNKSNDEVLLIYKETRMFYDRIGRESRLKKLIEKGKYKDIAEHRGICKYCGNPYLHSVRTKVYKYMLEGFCSSVCFTKSGENFKLRKKTYLRNRNVEFTEYNLDELYSKELSLECKNYDQTYRKTMKYKENGIKGDKKRKITFLIKNNIVSGETIENMGEDEISNLFLKNFNKIDDHGKKIHNGLLKKYGNTVKIADEFRRRFDLSFKNFLSNIDNIDNIDVDKMLELKKKFYSSRGVKDVLNWKKSHLIHRNINLETGSEEEIDKLYSEYISNRFKTLSNSIHNGYKQTKKGWYSFKNIKNDFFYRSSWELKVYETLDYLMGQGIVSDVEIPKRIPYTFENKNRNYYPDIQYVVNNGKKIVCEIKPFSKICDPLNVAKFTFARMEHENFFICTENEIFSDEIEKYLIEGCNNDNNR